MAYKCKVCGYRFKPEDDDLCPQCFTARDDINCDDLPGHSHEKDISYEQNDFLNTEQARERIPTYQEIEGNIRRTYDQSVKNYNAAKNEAHKSSSNTSATAHYIAQNYSFDVKGGQSGSTHESGRVSVRKTTQNDPMGRKIKGFAVFIIIFCTVISLVPTIRNVVYKSTLSGNQSQKETSRRQGLPEDFEVTIDMPEMPDMPNISVPDIEADGEQQYDYNYTLDDGSFISSNADIDGQEFFIVSTGSAVAMDYSGVQQDQVEFFDKSLQSKDFFANYIDIVDENGKPIERTECTYTMYGLDNAGNPVYGYWSQLDEDFIIVSAKVQYCNLHVHFVDENGQEHDPTFIFTLSDLLGFKAND